jgi:hypothetical protein
MCIYSTNTGNQISTFNPEPRGNTNEFAVLGEGFKHPDPLRVAEDRISGTSSESFFSPQDFEVPDILIAYV